MSRGATRNPKLKPSEDSISIAPGAPSPPAANESTASFSSGETIKAAKCVTKSAFKELLGGGGNNKSIPKVPKKEQVLVSGRGGARKGIPPPPPKPGPSNAEKLNALLASVSELHPPRDSETATVSSLAPSSLHASDSSKKSKATIRHAVREVLGGGGNDHGIWKYEPEFHSHYGRGGAYRAPTISSSSASSGIEILSDACSSSSSLSIARNSNGLFFFGRGRRSPEEFENGSVHSTFLVVGPGEGIIHPTAEHPFHQVNRHAGNSALTRSVMNKSGMSKVSVKIAVRHVLGGGGNDDGQWKYIDVFYPSFGRGGEGARGLYALDDIFNPFKVLPRRQRSSSIISFPSISSDTSSIYASSVVSGESSISSLEEQEDDATDILDDDVYSHHAHHDLATPHRPLPDPAGQDSLHVNFDSTVRIRAMSDSQPIHSEELIRFRNNLQERRRLRLEAQSKFRDREAPPAASERESINISPKKRVQKPDVSLPTSSETGSSSSSSTYRSVVRTLNAASLATESPFGIDPSFIPPAPSQLPPPPKVFPPGPGRPALAPPLPLPLPSTSSPLAYHLTLIQSRTAAIEPMQEQDALSSSLSQIDQEGQALHRERELLAARVKNLKREIARREKTIEGLTWLVGNLPEHQGMQVVVDDGQEMDDETMTLMREAEAELLQAGYSDDVMGGIQEEDPALPDSPVDIGIAV